MIIGNLQHTEDYTFLEENVKQCFAYVKEHDLLKLAPGDYEIDGKRLYIKIEEYETGTVGRSWEAHQEYLDVQILLKGSEQIDVGFTEQMETIEYMVDKDMLRLAGETKMSLRLAAGDFAIFYPHDAHQSHLAVSSPEQIKKAVFKVQIQKESLVRLS